MQTQKGERSEGKAGVRQKSRHRCQNGRQNRCRNGWPRGGIRLAMRLALLLLPAALAPPLASRPATAQTATAPGNVAVAQRNSPQAQRGTEDYEQWQDARQMSAEQARSFAAIGRIARSDAADPSGQVCTGVLVGPDLVLTARHCLPPAGAAGDVRFAAGIYDGIAVATRRGRELIASAEGTTRSTALALLRLDRPIPPDEVAPLPMAPPIGSGGVTAVPAYSNHAKARPSYLDPCGVLGSRGPALLLDCPVISGNSGAPVLADGDAARPGGIVGTIVGYTPDTRRLTVAMALPRDLRAVIDAGPRPLAGR